ncbi:hypothetical protein P691DRAFT_802630 [Macrolepiota fuliginosa MF-IS2]|uniref:DUF6699 domain-containing protein n=1 Tax=Macrolepiota fuliginosa MF-IS2 TaxID=1400762 RepID=A0A9P6C0G0_9AGAR|nr:hypothetical protein P691DRAFT_802630 [Macrolepiota fuliginosa MF-IS2]
MDHLIQVPNTLTDPPHTTLTMTRDSNRRVRFVLDGRSSPISTSSTLSSSPGPQTPPQLSQHLAVDIYQPPSSIPSLPISPNQLALAIKSSIHEYLEMPPFNFDVSVDPGTNPAMRNSPHLQSVSDSPATSSHLPSFTLVSQYLPWEIVILPSSKSYVTVSDVLYGLYRGLRLPVSHDEYAYETEDKKDKISFAYHRRLERYASNPGLMEQEMQKGVKRVDYLTGVHRFGGISETGRPGVFKLRLKPYNH